jgi:protein-tyrosine phosphatase
MTALTRNFGTLRGLIRLMLAHAEVALGRDGSVPPDPAAVRRLVFVCHGNICRSALAEAVAQREGLRTASFGLSTSSGKSAHPPACDAARDMGFDLSAHRTTRVEDFAVQPGDLLLAMETRHLRKLSAIPALANTPRLLLGRTIGVPHLHDPYQLDPAYMPVALHRTARAVRALAAVYPGAKASAPH